MPGTTSQDELTSPDASARLALRRNAIAARDAIPAEARRAASEIITQRLTEYLTIDNSSFIHCYLSFRSEVETEHFLRLLLATGSEVAVPSIIRVDGTEVMEHVALHSLNMLREAAYGIHEPALRTHAKLDGLDAVIVPLTAFDRRGTRLGYGKGFYDRFLATLPRSVTRIGLAFAIQETPLIPRLEHDEALDIVITEGEVIRCEESSPGS